MEGLVGHDEDFSLYSSTHHPSPEAIRNWTKMHYQSVEIVGLGLGLKQESWVLTKLSHSSQYIPGYEKWTSA